MLLVAPLIWLAFGLWAMGMQQAKGQSGCLGFFLGIVFGPVGVLVCWLDKGRPCPYCRGSLHPDAVKCPRCQSQVMNKWQEDIERSKARMLARAERSVRREQQPGWFGNQLRRLKAWHEEWKSRP